MEEATWREDDALERLRIDRNFYRRMLELESCDELEALLSDALNLIVDATQAEQAYLELGDKGDPAKRHWSAHGCDAPDIEAIQVAVSRGVIAEAVRSGSTVATASALVDPRFERRASVREHGIEAVLCTPIGGAPPRGVLYLQGRRSGGPFSNEDRRRAELFARQIAGLIDDLLTAPIGDDEDRDHTSRVRERLACTSIVGRSRAMARVLEQIALVAPLDIDVLVTGASGTGKTALAQVLVDASKRRGAALVELNCAALPESLVESELFGAVRGGHSTATEAIRGKVAAAAGGTLFLDEIGELSLSAQAKLLQLLQSRQYYPLGASKAVHADVRIIAATNADLQALVDTRRFREDLFYRLHVMPIRVPSLEARREDIPVLVTYFVERAAARHRLRPCMPSSSALLACRDAAWPGNIRELANAVEAAVIRAHGDGSSRLERHHLWPEFLADPDESDALSFQDATRRFQRSFLSDALERGQWNIARVARELGLTRSHMYNLIHGHGLRR